MRRCTNGTPRLVSLKVQESYFTLVFGWSTPRLGVATLSLSSSS